MMTLDELNEILEPHWSENPVWRHPDVGPGWYSLVVELTSKLAEQYPGFKIAQIKQKLGDLRYYVDGYILDFEGQDLRDSGMYRLINEYEARSRVTCEECGEPGDLDSFHYWLMTLCETHRNERRVRAETTDRES